MPRRLLSWLRPFAPPPKTAMPLVAAKAETISSHAEFCAGRAMPAYPLEVFIEISNVCDLKCVMCAEFSSLSRERLTKLAAKKRGFLSEDEIVARLEPVLRHSLAVHCSGFGEPTIHPQFRSIIERVSSYDVLIDFITNGMQLAGDLGDFIVQRGVHKIMISMSGATPEMYETLYVGGSFERVLAGIRHVAAAKKAHGTNYPIIEINSLAFRDHVASFDRFVELMAEAGANVVHLKTLQPYLSVPQLYEHVSIMRPWVEGAIIERAIAIGKRLGIHVDAGQYVAGRVADEAEYEARLAVMRELVDGRMGAGTFGASPTETFADIARTVVPDRGRADPSRPKGRILPETDTREDTTGRLRLEPHAGSAGFHCMEPFKTMYVNRNGGVKTCCFARDAGWLMGDVGATEPTAIWNGTGYSLIREGVVHGSYPLANCDFCLDHRIAPAASNAPSTVRSYLDWHASRHGPVLHRMLAEHAPDAIARIATARTDDVMARLSSAPPPPIPPPTAAVLSVPLEKADRALIEGNLERLDDEVVGWVYSPIHPGRALQVQVWRADVMLTQQTADLFRGDLADAGKGDGRHSFAIMLAEANDSLEVTAELNGTYYRFPSPPSPS